MQPVFTTNESEITRLEGLYVKERNPPAVISGANFSGVGVVGECVRGPVDKVVTITSPARFEEVFGGRDKGAGGATIVGKVWLALLNKKFGTLYVVRAAAAAAAAAAKNFPDGGAVDIVKIEASSRGTWGNDLSVAIVDATDGVANHFNVEVTYLGRKIVYKNLDCTTGNDNLLKVLGDDDANLVKITKLASGRPVNAGAGALNGTAGTDGAIADSDFTAAGRGLNLLTTLQGVGARFVAERSNSNIKTAINTAAASTHEGSWLLCADAETTSAATAKTDAANYRSDRNIYTFNHPYTLDPETATEVVTHPTSWMACVLSQTDVDIHPGEEDTKVLLAGIKRLYNETYTREDYIGLKGAGICALEKDDGFAFVSGVTTSLTPGKEQITRRRMTDYLQIAQARFMKGIVKKKNTETRRKAQMAAAIAFLSDLQRSERIVEQFSVSDELNTENQRDAGVEKLFERVKLIRHMLHVVLETEIGTAVKFTEAA